MTKASAPSAETKIDHATMVRKTFLHKTKTVLSQRQTNVIVYLPRLKMIAKAGDVNGGRRKKKKGRKIKNFSWKTVEGFGGEQNANKQSADNKQVKKINSAHKV